MTKKDYYEVLGVSRETPPEEIKKAYRQAALKFHPDRNPGDKDAEDRFKEASEAYEVLADPQKRERYNRFGHAGLAGTGFHPFNDVNDIFSSFGDIFEDFFGFSSSRRAHRTRRGNDLSVELEISFNEACFGIEKSIEISRHESCQKCHGQGTAPGSRRETCPRCQGSGQVGRSQGFFMIATTCNQCHGTGTVISNPCPECRGQGREVREKKLTVKVPPGVDDGTRLVLQGEGEAGQEGGGRGDLYIFLRVHPHDHFVREGSTIYSEEPVSFVIAALGGEIEVETLDGKVKIQVPKGSETGDTVVLDGAGVPHLRSRKRGDHMVKIVVKIPKKLTDQQERLLKEFASLSGEKNSFSSKKKKKGFFS